ncbi:MAG: type II toxin-antitoxin system HicA family toxin [Chloroflexota bacterium]
MPVNKKHQKTLEAIFEDPVKANISWRDIEALFEVLGAEISEGSGSRMRVALNGVRAVFHRPHPRPETKKGAVKSVRRFLIEAGVTI